jgi:hypothetical protein
MDNHSTHFTFFASYYDSVERLDSSTKGEFFDVLFRYALRNEHPASDVNPVVYALFTMAKPNIDKSKAKREAGQAGGKQTVSKSEANSKQTVSKSEKTVSDKEKEKEKDINKKPPLKKPIGFVYDELFEELWGEIKTGDKWNAYRAWITKRDNYRHADLLNVVKMENDKQFGKRHLSTLFNSDIDTMLEDTKPTPSNKPVRYV